MRRTMRGALVVSAAATALGGLAAATASAKDETYNLSGKLTSGVEVPKPSAPAGAGGTFTGTLTGKKLSFTLTFKGLSGAAIAGHIHMGKKGAAGPVALPFCPPKCKSPIKGTFTVKGSLRDAIERGGAYVNLHTQKNPGGEIRAQIVSKEG